MKLENNIDAANAPTLHQFFSDNFNMSLRDYIAVNTMRGSLSNSDAVTDMSAFANWCYRMADAMLAARENSTASDGLK